MEEKKIKKVAVTGPESTGKTTLSQQLAGYFNAGWVPEFARDYIGRLERPYEEGDLLKIAKGQVQLEKEMASTAGRLLICDTELTVIKIWSEHAYGRVHSWIVERLQRQDHDVYLLMDVDLPWEEDPQREHPHLRQYFLDWYIREMEACGRNFYLISGSPEERLEKAVALIT